MMSSETNVITTALRALHRIHQQLADLRERLDRGPRLARAHAANLQRLQAALEAAKAELAAARKLSDAKQKELQDAETGLERRRTQLRQSTSNKEYQALNDQIAASEMTNSVLADEALEAMEPVSYTHLTLPTIYSV